jgi:PAS domain S-box-containing protein
MFDSHIHPVDMGMGKKISDEGGLTVLDQAPIAILVVDSSFRCTYANRAAETFTGVNVSEIIDRSIWETFPALQDSAFDTQATRSLMDRKRIPFEFHYAPSAKWFDVELVPLSNGLAIYLIDSTERRKAIDAAQSGRIGEDMTGQAAPAADSGKTVLLVDDDESMRRVTRRILAKSGFRVIEAEHGADALRVAAAHEGEIDLLVTDVLMPGIRGPELVEELTVRSPGLRVLYMSGYTDDDISRWGLQPGIAFIHKPFTSEGFTEAVNEVLSATR